MQQCLLRTNTKSPRWTDIIHCPCEVHSLMVPLTAWYWWCWFLAVWASSLLTILWLYPRKHTKSTMRTELSCTTRTLWLWEKIKLSGLIKQWLNVLASINKHNTGDEFWLSQSAKVAVSEPRSLEAVMAAKGASTNYSLKGLDAKFEVFLQKSSQIQQENTEGNWTNHQYVSNLVPAPKLLNKHILDWLTDWGRIPPSAPVPPKRWLGMHVDTWQKVTVELCC